MELHIFTYDTAKVKHFI